MTKGIIMFAHNNQSIDYFKIACVNALMIKKNLKTNNITLVTNQDTINSSIQNLGEEFVNKCFENIIIESKELIKTTNNKRLYRDSINNSETISFLNHDHFLAYELSPYDETIFIDADYLVQSDVLNCLWGCDEDLLITHSVKEALKNRNTEVSNLADTSIRLYWATVVYFKKSETSKRFFDLWQMVFENYQYYRQLFQIQRQMFRNDFAASIAMFILNGCTNKESKLPFSLMKTFDIDEVVDIGNNSIKLLMKDNDNFVLSNVKNIDIHIMNKYSLLRQFEKFVEIYD